MPSKHDSIPLYHITDVENLPSILADGGLSSDAVMAARPGNVIGHSHIKERRLTQIMVPCAGDRFVGEFVPFYYCPRSPMLYTVNEGATGKPPGCQRSIVHLVTNVGFASRLGVPFAISDGNAGAFHTSFRSDVDALDRLDWAAISETYWQAVVHQKAAEFLVADSFPWTGIFEIGCHDEDIVEAVRTILASAEHRPQVTVQRSWYY